MSECTAYREGDNVKDTCKKCKKHYTVRDDKNMMWQPSTEIPIGACGYTDVPLCHNCRMELVNLVSKFLTKHN